MEWRRAVLDSDSLSKSSGGAVGHRDGRNLNHKQCKHVASYSHLDFVSFKRVSDKRLGHPYDSSSDDLGALHAQKPFDIESICEIVFSYSWRLQPRRAVAFSNPVTCSYPSWTASAYVSTCRCQKVSAWEHGNKFTNARMKLETTSGHGPNG